MSISRHNAAAAPSILVTYTLFVLIIMASLADHLVNTCLIKRCRGCPGKAPVYMDLSTHNHPLVTRGLSMSRADMSHQDAVSCALPRDHNPHVFQCLTIIPSSIGFAIIATSPTSIPIRRPRPIVVHERDRIPSHATVASNLPVPGSRCNQAAIEGDHTRHHVGTIQPRVQLTCGRGGGHDDPPGHLPS